MNENLENLLKTRILNFKNRVIGNIISESHPLGATISVSKESSKYSERKNGESKPVQIGEVWGENWDSAWIHLQSDIPENFKDKELALQLNFGGEALLFSKQGQPIYGLTNCSVFDKDYKKEFYRLPKNRNDNYKIDMWVEAAANGLFGLGLDPGLVDGDADVKYNPTVSSMNLVVFDTENWNLFLDINTLESIYQSEPRDSRKRAVCINHLNNAITAYEKSKGDATLTRNFLNEELSKPAYASSIEMYAIGHAHIDIAWLWRVAETRRKAARTFASQLDLIDKYPEYVFGASQPQLYQFIKEDYPELFERIKKAVKKGQWECQGGMWVEPDCNIPSGESLVRQIIHGKNFFKDEFDVDVNNVWLPDVFGYSAAMPQIMKKSGIDFFLTQKISWSQINTFPHSTFLWEGIDGSKVVTHFPPEDNYNGFATAKSLKDGEKNFKQKGTQNKAMSLYGIGNGGGGPQEEHVEQNKRSKNTESVPRLKFSTAKAFFYEINKTYNELDKWKGELYLELHRGTLTTQALVKKRNRFMEKRMHELEMLWSMADSKLYPREDFDKIWKKILINQFHDILPGSSIKEVYEDTHKEYEQMFTQCNNLEEKIADILFTKQDDSVVLFNSLSQEFEGNVSLPTSWGNSGAIINGVPVPVQMGVDGLFAYTKIGAMSQVTLQKSNVAENGICSLDDLILENDLIRYELNKDAQVIRIYDKQADREIAVESKHSNILTLYDDHVNDWDAWDIDHHNQVMDLETAKSVKISKIENGSIRQTINADLTIGNSKINQKITLSKNSKQLDFVTNVDWNEKHKMLRTNFPVELYNSRARFDIQYGYVERNTHNNTSWDVAKFEGVAHKYADLSENEYGVALLNDSKYGHNLKDNELDLCLLRSPTYPDPTADIGKHEFVYSLLPHTGDLVHSNVMKLAFELNNPPVVFDGYKSNELPSICNVSNDDIQVAVIKGAEKDKNTVVVRLVEQTGKPSITKVNIGKQFSKVVETNLIEWDNLSEMSEKELNNLKFKPFEIRTFKFRLKS